MQTWGTPNALQFLKWVTAKDSAPPPTHPFMSRGHILSQKLSCHLRLRLGFRLSSYPVISFQGLGGSLKARFASNLEPVCVYSKLFLLPLSGSFLTLCTIFEMQVLESVPWKDPVRLERGWLDAQHCLPPCYSHSLVGFSL